MLAHLTERGLELEPVGHNELYAINAFRKANPDVKVYIIGETITAETKEPATTTKKTATKKAKEVADPVVEEVTAKKVLVEEVKAEEVKAEDPAPSIFDEAPVEEVKQPSKEDFREALKAYAIKNSMEKTEKLLAGFGYKNVSQVPVEKYLTIMEAAK